MLSDVSGITARALMVWIVGEYCSSGQISCKVLSSIFQYLAYCFIMEDFGTKQHILNIMEKF